MTPLKVSKLIFLTLVLVASFVRGEIEAKSWHHPSALERQSSTPRQMFQNFRDGMQRTLRGFVDTIRRIPQMVRPSPPPPPPPPHPAHHSLSPPPPLPPLVSSSSHNSLGPNEGGPPPPVFKPTPRTSFAVFNLGRNKPSPPVLNEVDNHHFQVHRPVDNAIHHFSSPSSGSSIFFFQPQQRHPNFNFDGENQQKKRHVIGSASSGFQGSGFQGSALMQDNSNSVDGWKVIRSPHLPSQNSHFHVPVGDTTRSNEENKKQKKLQISVYKAQNPVIKSIVIVTPPSETVTPGYANTFPEVQAKAVIPKPYPKKKLHLRPKPFAANRRKSSFPPNVPSSLDPSPNLSPKGGVPLQRNRKRQSPYLPEAPKLFSKGYKLQTEHDPEQGSSISGYEYGYGLRGDHEVFLAEEKQDGVTRGSYKVTLPDGASQSVKYMVNDETSDPGERRRMIQERRVDPGERRRMIQERGGEGS